MAILEMMRWGRMGAVEKRRRPTFVARRSRRREGIARRRVRMGRVLEWRMSWRRRCSGGIVRVAIRRRANGRRRPRSCSGHISSWRRSRPVVWGSDEVSSCGVR